MGEPRIAHMAPGGVVDLRFLQVECAAREAVKIAHVVVVQMGQDHVLDRIGVDADQPQRFDRSRRVRLRFLATSAVKPVSIT